MRGADNNSTADDFDHHYNNDHHNEHVDLNEYLDLHKHEHKYFNLDYNEHQYFNKYLDIHKFDNEQHQQHDVYQHIDIHNCRTFGAVLQLWSVLFGGLFRSRMHGTWWCLGALRGRDSNHVQRVLFGLP